MPKLNPNEASQVKEAEAAGGSFLLEPGRYAAQLREVEARQGASGYDYWSWTYENLHDEDGTKKAGRQWNNTSLSPKALGFLKGTFEAFGTTPETDTDELIGQWVVLHIDQEPAVAGPRAGQLRNVVTQLARFKAEDWAFEATTPKAADSRDEF